MYGSNKAPRAWYGKLDSHLVQLGFKRRKNRPTLYLKQDSYGLQLVISFYVDGMFVTGSNEVFEDQFKAEMENLFEISGLGKMKYFLGIEIVQNDSGIFISEKVCRGLVIRFKLDICKEATTLVVNEKISNKMVKD